MSNTLSHTQLTKYQNCPKEWELHYRQGYRAKGQPAALLFGSAIDKAIEGLLKDSSCDAYSIFDKNWSFAEINKKLVPLFGNPDVQYTKSDYDEELLLDEDKVKLEGIDVNVLLEKETLNPMEVINLNKAYWLSLRRKGQCLVHTFQSEVMPKITKIHAVQKQIKLDNGSGDTIVGYVDLVCDYEGYGTVVFDLKTASREYDKAAVLTSSQLSLYVHALSEEYNTRKAGYIVLVKKLIKDRTKVCSVCGFEGTGSRARTCTDETKGTRCNGAWIEKINPRCLKQILVDEIPQQTEDIVIQNTDYINQSIKNGIFYRNLGSCVKAWGKCCYFNLCYKNDSSDLVKT